MPKDEPAARAGDSLSERTERRPRAEARAAHERAHDGDTRSAPLFRVVEIVRDARGRLRHEGRIWQTDLTRLRRFGRAIAANTASHRVVVADTAGNVLEEIPIALPESRQALWTDWQALDLPPLPARAARPRPLKPVRQEPVSTPVSPSPIDLEATVRALHQAAGAATPVADAVPDAPKGDDASAAAAPTDEDGADVLLP